MRHDAIVHEFFTYNFRVVEPVNLAFFGNCPQFRTWNFIRVINSKFTNTVKFCSYGIKLCPFALSVGPWIRISPKSRMSKYSGIIVCLSTTIMLFCWCASKAMPYFRYPVGWWLVCFKRKKNYKFHIFSKKANKFATITLVDMPNSPVIAASQ